MICLHTGTLPFTDPAYISCNIICQTDVNRKHRQHDMSYKYS